MEHISSLLRAIEVFFILCYSITQTESPPEGSIPDLHPQKVRVVLFRIGSQMVSGMYLFPTTVIEKYL